MAEYIFTQDWFYWAPEIWSRLAAGLPERKNFLEIGSFEGRSTVWTVENMLEDGGSLTCIDPWPTGGDYGDDASGTAEDHFDHNLGVLHERFPARSVLKAKGFSISVVAGLIDRFGVECVYDFIYVDGSHTAPAVLTDACMVLPLLKRGGVIVFDDYLWGEPKDILHRPKLAVDAFVNIFAESVDIIHLGYQMAVR